MCFLMYGVVLLPLPCDLLFLFTCDLLFLFTCDLLFLFTCVLLRGDSFLYHSVQRCRVVCVQITTYSSSWGNKDRLSKSPK